MENNINKKTGGIVTKGYREVKSKIDCGVPVSLKKSRTATKSKLVPRKKPSENKNRRNVSNLSRAGNRKPLSDKLLNTEIKSSNNAQTSKRKFSTDNVSPPQKKQRLDSVFTVKVKPSVRSVATKIKVTPARNCSQKSMSEKLADWKKRKEEARSKEKRATAFGSSWNIPSGHNDKKQENLETKSRPKSDRRYTICAAQNKKSSVSTKSFVSKRHSIGVPKNGSYTNIKSRTSLLPENDKGTASHVQKAEAVVKKVKPKPRKSILKPVYEDIPQTPADQQTVTVKTPRSVKFMSPAQICNRKTKYKKTPAKIRRRSKADMSIRERLEAWLEEKGKTPSRYHHLRCFGHELSVKKVKSQTEILTPEQLQQQQNKLANEAADGHVHGKDVAVNLNEELAREENNKENTDGGHMLDEEPDPLTGMLDECYTLHEAGCPVLSITQWLDEIEQNVPHAKKRAEYWMTRAKVVESQGDTLATVSVYEQAIINGAQPAELIASSMREFVLRVANYNTNQNQSEKEELCTEPSILPSQELQAQHVTDADTKLDLLSEVNESTTPVVKQQTRTPRRSYVEAENVFESSSIKYCVSENSNYFKRLQETEQTSPGSSKPLPTAVVTPVRRSTRRSVTELPRTLQDDRIVDDLESLTLDSESLALYVPNSALLNDSDLDTTDLSDYE